MLRYIFIIFFSVLLNSNLHSEIVKKFSVEGNKRISDETIKIYGDIKLNQEYSENDLNEILRSLYETEFFEDIKVNLKNNVLTISVKEYPFINQLVITGEKSKKYIEQIKKIIKLKEKRSFITSYLANDIERIKNLYSSVGFNSSKVEIKTRKIDSNSFDLLIEIDRGNKTKIKSINFIGNKKINNRRLRSVIASEETKFWKVLSRNTNFTDNLSVTSWDCL